MNYYAFKHLGYWKLIYNPETIARLLDRLEREPHPFYRDVLKKDEVFYGQVIIIPEQPFYWGWRHEVKNLAQLRKVAKDHKVPAEIAAEVDKILVELADTPYDKFNGIVADVELQYAQETFQNFGTHIRPSPKFAENLVGHMAAWHEVFTRFQAGNASAGVVHFDTYHVVKFSNPKFRKTYLQTEAQVNKR